MITPANALKWSIWLAQNHPLAFKAVVRALRSPTPAPQSLGRYSFARGRFGYLGQDDGVDQSVVGDFSTPDMETITVQTPAVDASSVDLSNTPLPDPTLADLNVTQPASVNFDLSGASQATDTSGGFWSSLGSGLSSLGSGVASAVGSVAKAVTNPQVLAGAAQVAASVITTNAAAAQRAQAANILAAQTQRTLTGAGPAAIQWAVNPATGQQTPYYYNAATRQYQLTTPSAFSTILPANLSAYLPYILVGGGLILVLALARK